MYLFVLKYEHGTDEDKKQCNELGNFGGHETSSNWRRFFNAAPLTPEPNIVSADAIQWLNNHMEGGVGIERGIDIMQVETQTFLSVQYNLQNLILLLFFISI